MNEIESHKINLTLPYPPSLNTMWRYANGRVYSNKTANDFKRFVKVLCRQNRIKAFAKTKKLIFTMRVFRPTRAGDLDNRIKLILDALNRNAFYDDAQIVEIHAYRLDDAENPRVEVEITESPNFDE